MADVKRKGDREVNIMDATFQYSAKITEDGRMRTSQEVTAPADTTPVDETAQGDVTGNADTIYTIPNTSTLVIQTLSAGAEGGVDGSKVSLYEDPNGDLSVLNLISVLYVNMSSESEDVGRSFVGDGTKRIVLRRTGIGGGAREIYGRWRGYY